MISHAIQTKPRREKHIRITYLPTVIPGIHISSIFKQQGHNLRQEQAPKNKKSERWNSKSMKKKKKKHSNAQIIEAK